MTFFENFCLHQNFRGGDRNSQSNYSRQPSNSSNYGGGRRRMGSHSSQGSHSNHYGNNDSAFQDPPAGGPGGEQPQRRRLNLKARTKPLDAANEAPVRNAAIFGTGQARDETVKKQDSNKDDNKSSPVKEIEQGVKNLSTN